MEGREQRTECAAGEQASGACVKQKPVASRPSRYDYLLTLVILGLSVWSFFLLSRRLSQRETMAQVYCGGTLMHQLDLTVNREVAIADGAMNLEIRDRKIRVMRSSFGTAFALSRCLCGPVLLYMASDVH